MFWILHYILEYSGWIRWRKNLHAHKTLYSSHLTASKRLWPLLWIVTCCQHVMIFSYICSWYDELMMMSAVKDRRTDGQNQVLRVLGLWTDRRQFHQSISYLDLNTLKLASAFTATHPKPRADLPLAWPTRPWANKIQIGILKLGIRSQKRCSEVVSILSKSALLQRFPGVSESVQWYIASNALRQWFASNAWMQFNPIIIHRVEKFQIMMHARRPDDRRA